MIKDRLQMLDSDFIINDIKIIKEIKYNRVYQCDKEFVTIEKYVYKNHNDIFTNHKQSQRPKQRCVFTLHDDNKSSFVEIFDNKNKLIFAGNSLWSRGKDKDSDKHLIFITRLHSTQNVKENYDC